MEVVNVPTIFMRDPFLRLKRGKKGPPLDQRVKVQPVKVEKGSRRRLLLSRGSEGQSLLEKGNKLTARLRLLPRGQWYMSLRDIYSFLVPFLRLAKRFVLAFAGTDG